MKPEKDVSNLIVEAWATLSMLIQAYEDSFSTGITHPRYIEAAHELEIYLRESIIQSKEIIQSLEDNEEKISELQIEIRELQTRLAELQDFENRSEKEGGVFVSYSHSDKDIVQEIVRRFESDGINYWLDDKDLLVGQVIDKAISEGIQKNWLFLIVLSPSSIRSKWVQREFDEASHEEVEGNKTILPVVCGGLERQEIPTRIRRKFYTDMSRNFETGYEKLKRSILFYLQQYSSDH